jgi:hypothetical protein
MAVGAPAPVVAIADLLRRLRSAVGGRETVDVAQLQFVGMENIARAYGERWDASRTRIQDAAESFLQNRIGDRDLLVRGEEGFLIVLGKVEGPQAYAMAAELSHGLNAFFLGEGSALPTPRIAHKVETMAVRDIERHVGRREALAASAPATAQDVTWKFEPVWDVRREVLSYWYLAPFGAKTGRRIPGYQFEAGSLSPADLLRMDEEALWLTEQTLVRQVEAGRQAIIGVTLHVQSLAGLAARARILATIDRLKGELHRLRVIKVAGVTHGFPRMYINEIVGALRSRVPNIVLLATWDEPDLASLRHPGLTGIGIVAPPSDFAAAPATHAAALIQRVRQAADLAHAARMRLLVEGAVTKYLAMKFASVGADNMSSQRIWPAREMAEGVERWPAGHLAAA